MIDLLLLDVTDRLRLRVTSIWEGGPGKNKYNHSEMSNYMNSLAPKEIFSYSKWIVCAATRYLICIIMYYNIKYGTSINAQYLLHNFFKLLK